MRDYHVHTSFCDGNNTPTEMINKAFSLGFETIGLTGHSYTPFDESYCMSLGRTDDYIKEIMQLKKMYEGKMEVLCGVEQDYFAPLPDEKTSPFYDYKIGSVHYVKVGEEYLSIDEAPEVTQSIISNYFNGSFEDFAECYFSLVGDVLDKTNADIIGHFDLISKFADALKLDINSVRYLNAGFKALERLIPYGKPFEINIGAMTRGWRAEPYPSTLFLKEIHRLGGKIIITGDCHSASSLGDYLEEGRNYARKCGFTKETIIENGKFIEKPL